MIFFLIVANWLHLGTLLLETLPVPYPSLLATQTQYGMCCPPLLLITYGVATANHLNFGNNSSHTQLGVMPSRTTQPGLYLSH